MKHAGRLIVLVGPAGAGKTTLAHRLVDAAPATRGFSVSHTTRPMRSGEVDGRDYHFVQRSAFEALAAAGGLAEWAEVHGNLYGTSKAEIERHLSAGRDILFDIDIVGAHNLWHSYAEQTRLCFVLPPTWQTLKDRLARRGSETPGTMQRRLRTARRELQALAQSPAPWSVVVNDQLDGAVTAAEALFAPQQPETAGLDKHPLLQAFLQDASTDPLAADA